MLELRYNEGAGERLWGGGRLRLRGGSDRARYSQGMKAVGIVRI